MAQVLDINALLTAKKIADEFHRRFDGEIQKAKRAGYKLVYKLEQEEQIGRGTANVVRVRLIPEAHVRIRQLARLGQTAIEGKAWYDEPIDVFDGIKDALEVAFDFASDHGVI